MGIIAGVQCAAQTPKQRWIEHNQDTTKRLARAVVRALRYIAENSPETIVSRVPAAYRSPDTSVDVAAMTAWRGLFSTDGVTPPESFDAVRRMVALTFDKVRSKDIDPSKTYTNQFVSLSQ